MYKEYVPTKEEEEFRIMSECYAPGCKNIAISQDNYCFSHTNCDSFSLTDSKEAIIDNLIAQFNIDKIIEELNLGQGYEAKDLFLDLVKVTLGQRQLEYGDPAPQLTRIGRMWGAMLDVPDIPPEKVAALHVAEKLIRMDARVHLDSHVDVCGYVSIMVDFLVLYGKLGTEDIKNRIITLIRKIMEMQKEQR